LNPTEPVGGWRVMSPTSYQAAPPRAFLLRNLPLFCNRTRVLLRMLSTSASVYARTSVSDLPIFLAASQIFSRTLPQARPCFRMSLSVLKIFFLVLRLRSAPYLSRRRKPVEVWGSGGREKAKPIHMGMLPRDSDVNRRWAFKSDDPRVLAQIDGIFVTLESEDGNRSPSGRPFLYADLRSAPNVWSVVDRLRGGELRRRKLDEGDSFASRIPLGYQRGDAGIEGGQFLFSMER
jgi:hypothetical protein